MISMSKNVYINKLADTFNEYSNAYHRTIKLEPDDIRFSTHIYFGVENND